MPWVGYDPAAKDQTTPVPASYDRVIVASPTDTHARYIAAFGQSDKPILCEKPISKDDKEFHQIMAFAQDENVNLQMVNQYEYIPFDRKIFDETVYDYYNTGSDGICWDCINIIGLANGHVIIRDESPIWICAINGHQVYYNDLERAYIQMIGNWLEKPQPNIDYIYKAHEKAREYIGKGGNGINRSSGPLN